MADRPILYSAPMIRAQLLGHKTQTRRILSSARVFATPEQSAFTMRGEQLERALQGADRFRHLHGDAWFWEADAFEWQAPSTRTGWMAHLGFSVGDRLWVKETWFAESWYDRHKAEDRPRVIAEFREPRIWYDAGHLAGAINPFIMRASPLDLDAQWSKGIKRVSIHMPRFASRLTNIVTAVRVERLQDCSEADALAEGVQQHPDGGSYYIQLDATHTLAADTAAGVYRALWDHINGAGAWAANPWVIALTFEVHQSNIDQLPAHTVDCGSFRIASPGPCDCGYPAGGASA